MDQMDEIRYVLDLVGLKMSDEMPARGKVVQLQVLSGQFLNIVFAKIPKSRFRCFPDPIGPKGLGDRHKSDLIPRSSHPCTNSFQPGFQGFDILVYHSKTGELLIYPPK